jgi:Domain of unknown function (DUF4129)
VRTRRTLPWSVALALIVVVAAGITGTAHFGGARWVPDLSAPAHSAAPVTVPPQPSAPLRIRRPHHGGGFPAGTVVLLVLIALALITIAVLLWLWWVGRPTPAARIHSSVGVAAAAPVPSEPEPDPNTPALRTGIGLALQVLDEERDPADAIVQAWLGLQETAEESGITRRPAETPTEFTSRILSRALTDDRAIKTLLRLYLRTRFGDHPVTQDDVATVRTALQELLLTWPATPAGANQTTLR